MISLFLDTTYYNIIIGIYRDYEELYLKIEKSDNNLSQKLLPSIEEAFKQIKISIKSINRIYVVNGPGSFTGIRIGCTVAKTLAYALKREIITISELELLATTKTSKKYIVPFIDARRDYVYAGIYDNNINKIMENIYLPISTLKDKINDDYELVSYDNIMDNVVIPNINIIDIIKKHKDDISFNVHEIKPNYLKLTEAEEKLNDKTS